MKSYLAFRICSVVVMTTALALYEVSRESAFSPALILGFAAIFSLAIWLRNHLYDDATTFFDADHPGVQREKEELVIFGNHIEDLAHESKERRLLMSLVEGGERYKVYLCWAAMVLLAGFLSVRSHGMSIFDLAVPFLMLSAIFFAPFLNQLLMPLYVSLLLALYAWVSTDSKVATVLFVFFLFVFSLSLFMFREIIAERIGGVRQTPAKSLAKPVAIVVLLFVITYVAVDFALPEQNPFRSRVSTAGVKMPSSSKLSTEKLSRDVAEQVAKWQERKADAPSSAEAPARGEGGGSEPGDGGAGDGHPPAKGKSNPTTGGESGDQSGPRSSDGGRTDHGGGRGKGSPSGNSDDARGGDSKLSQRGGRGGTGKEGDASSDGHGAGGNAPDIKSGNGPQAAEPQSGQGPPPQLEQGKGRPLDEPPRARGQTTSQPEGPQTHGHHEQPSGKDTHNAGSREEGPSRGQGNHKDVQPGKPGDADGGAATEPKGSGSEREKGEPRASRETNTPSKAGEANKPEASPQSGVEKKSPDKAREEKVQKIQNDIKLSLEVVKGLLVVAGLLLILFVISKFFSSAKEDPENDVKLQQLTQKQKRKLQTLLQSLRGRNLAAEEEVIETYNAVLTVFEMGHHPREEWLPAEDFSNQISKAVPPVSAPFATATTRFSRTLYGRKMVEAPELQEFRESVAKILKFFQV